MSAFLDLLNTYAIWIYIAGVLVILFAIKMLADSRRQARTTMFTLEQEQASEKAFRAVLLMVGTLIVIGGISAVNTFVAPARPQQTPVIAQSTLVPYTPPLIPPTVTSVPTLTPEPPTATPATPNALPTKESQPAATPVKSTPPAPPPPLVPSPTEATGSPAQASYPKPPLNAPVVNDHISRGWIQFIWGQDGSVPGQLPPGQFYRVTIQYTDRNTNARLSPFKCSAVNSVDTRQWGKTIGDAQGNAVSSQFTWSVIVVQVPSGNPSDCDLGMGTPISPPSDTWMFFWQ
jgi:hypothetical protein